MKQNKSTTFLSVFPGALSIAGTLLLPGISIDLSNRSQFAWGLGSAVTIFGISLSILLLLSACVLLLFRNKKIFPAINAAAFGFCISAMLQYRCWSEFFPDMIVEDFFTPDMLILTALHLGFLLTPFCVAIFFREWILRRSPHLAAILLMTQVFSAIFPCMNKTAPDYDFFEYTFSEKEKFSFGSEDNIIVLVVDAMGENIAKEVMKKYPEIRALLKDFTCFDRMISPIPRTMYAVPAMLTGMNFPCDENEKEDDSEHAQYLNKACRSENSLFSALKKIGFRTEGYSFILQTISYAPDVIDNSIPLNYQVQKDSAIKILDTVLEKYVPFFLKPYFQNFYYIATDPFVTPREMPTESSRDAFDQVFYHRLQNEFKIGEHRKVFKYLHLHGAHAPVRTDEHLNLNPETIKYKQLRGSLKNVELLLEKLRVAKLYDNATIIIIGDHTERYTSETIAFIKRKAEQHEGLQYNSIPCQVSDIAGTVLKLYGVQTPLCSLWDHAPQPGDGHSRQEPANIYLDFDAFQVDAAIFDSSSRDVCQMPFQLDENRIVIEYLAAPEHKHLQRVKLFAVNQDSKTVFSAGRDVGNVPNYLRTAKLNLPDGNYIIFLQESFTDESNETYLACEVLPKFLTVKQRAGTFHDLLPDTPPRAINEGETVCFRILNTYPQLVMPEQWEILGNTLIIKESSSIGVRVPQADTKLFLKIVLKYPSMSPGNLIVSDGNGECANLAIKSFETIQCRIPVRTSENGIVKLRFEFVPMLRNRAPAKKDQRLKIESITLTAE